VAERGRILVSALPRAFHDEVIPALFSQGALDLLWLVVRGEPVAAIYNVLWRGRLYFYQCGRSLTLPATIRPGIVMHAHAIRSAIADGRREYDLLRGASQYKRRETEALVNTPVKLGNDRKASSKRDRLARALDLLGILDRLLWLRSKLSFQALTVLTYHRIGKADGGDELAVDVFDAEPEELSKQIAVIKTYGTVISMADFRLFQQGRKLPPNPVLLTFDDGYTDCKDVALPILQREGVSATFFIPTAYPDAGKLFFWDRVSLLMHRCRVERVELSYPSRLVLFPRRDPIAATALLCDSIKATPNLDMSRLWDELEQAAGVSLSVEAERAIAAKTIMSWSEVRALADAGMDIQSHSHSHRVLNTLTPASAHEDLLRSSTILQEVLGRAIDTVAYPVGYCLEGAMRRAPADANFALGFTNRTGVCNLSRFDPLNVPRLSMDIRTVGSLYKLVLLTGDRLSWQPRWSSPFSLPST
jgi:peptidoglycan/xylan/chitin deacetylase (PgdA/CDA1 family)